MPNITITGNPIDITTQNRIEFKSIIQNGLTTQSGAGDPSPTNIRPIYGVGQYDVAGFATGTAVSLVSETDSSIRVMCYTLAALKDVVDYDKKIFVSCLKEGVNGCTYLSKFGTRILAYFDKSKFPTLEALTAYLTSQKNVFISAQSTTYSTATQYYTGISIKNTNNYQGYGIDLGDKQLYGDTTTGVYDTFEPYVIVDGMARSRLTQRWGYLVLDGTETITLQDVSVLSVTISNPQKPYSAAELICNQAISAYTWSQNAFCFNMSGTFLNIGTNKFNTLTAIDLKSYLAAQYSARTPVTVLYQLATPIAILGEPVIINAKNYRPMQISATGGTITLSYDEYLVSNKKYQDIHLSDDELYSQFMQYWENNQYSLAFNILNNNPQLITKIMNANVINSMSGNLTYLQSLNDPVFKADRIPTSHTEPIGQTDNQVWFKIVSV